LVGVNSVSKGKIISKNDGYDPAGFNPGTLFSNYFGEEPKFMTFKNIIAK